MKFASEGGSPKELVNLGELKSSISLLRSIPVCGERTPLPKLERPIQCSANIERPFFYKMLITNALNFIDPAPVVPRTSSYISNRLRTLRCLFAVNYNPLRYRMELIAYQRKSSIKGSNKIPLHFNMKTVAFDRGKIK